MFPVTFNEEFLLDEEHAPQKKSHSMSSMLLYTTIIVYLLEPYLCFRIIVLIFEFQKGVSQWDAVSVPHAICGMLNAGGSASCNSNHFPHLKPRNLQFVGHSQHEPVIRRLSAPAPGSARKISDKRRSFIKITGVKWPQRFGWPALTGIFGSPCYRRQRTASSRYSTIFPWAHTCSRSCYWPSGCLGTIADRERKRFGVQKLRACSSSANQRRGQ
jgi:hypothetical protein